MHIHMQVEAKAEAARTVIGSGMVEIAEALVKRANAPRGRPKEKRALV